MVPPRPKRWEERVGPARAEEVGRKGWSRKSRKGRQERLVPPRPKRGGKKGLVPPRPNRQEERLGPAGVEEGWSRQD